MPRIDARWRIGTNYVSEELTVYCPNRAEYEDRLCAVMTSQTTNHDTTHLKTQTHGAIINDVANIAATRSRRFLKIRRFVLMNVGMITTTVDRRAYDHQLQGNRQAQEQDCLRIASMRHVCGGRTAR
jgi:hypothetical protein